MSTTTPPSHILIIGAGVFGLSAAHALVRRPRFARTRVTILSPDVGEAPTDPNRPLPSSVDTTRIIRSDYADPVYAQLAREAQVLWRRQDWGGNGKYNESGLLITATYGSEGAEYVRKSLANVRAEKATSEVRELSDPRGIADAMGIGSGLEGGSGDVGYINLASGWADAGRALKDLEVWLRRSNRVQFIRDEAVRLLTDEGSGSPRVIGVQLASGKTLQADSTILATGAWTPKLVDMRGIASARAQIMAYFHVTNTQAQAMQNMPVHLNLGNGCFMFPPNQNSDGTWEIKVARHSYGYSNPTTIPAPLGVEQGSIMTSLPSAEYFSIPPQDEVALSDFLSEVIPLFEPGQKPKRTRLCYYLDTAVGDFIVGHHPAYNVFVATGGSGHAYKMFPVLGEKVIDVFEGKDESLALIRKWRFPQRLTDEEVWCEDGSRSGVKNVTLEQAMMGRRPRVVPSRL